MIYGVDVSNWQGSYAWPKSGLAFGFAKATEGLTYTDVQFARNWSQMKTRGLVRGAYHFGHPGNSATSEADHFLSVVRGKGLAVGDLLALDLETTDGRSPAQVAAWAKAWCQRVQAQAGVRPIVYTYLSYAQGGYCAGLGGYPLWVAAPSYSAGHPPMPAGPWKSWVLHQYTDSPVDKDVSNLSAAALRALGGATSTQEEDVPPIRSSYSITKTEPVPWSTQTVLDWQQENADPKNAHSGANPGYVSPLSTWADMHVTLTIDGLDKTKGDEYQVSWQVHGWDDKTGKSTSTWTECTRDAPATSGHQYADAAFVKGLSANQHVYVAVTCFAGDGDTSRPAPKVSAGRWTIAQDPS